MARQLRRSVSFGYAAAAVAATAVRSAWCTRPPGTLTHAVSCLGAHLVRSVSTVSRSVAVGPLRARVRVFPPSRDPPRRPLPGKFSCFDTNVRPDSVVVGHCEVCPGRKRRPCLRTLKPRSKFLTTVLLSSFSRPQNSTDALPAVYARCSPLMTAAMHRGIVAGCRRIGRRSLPKVELLLLLLCSCVQGT